MHLSLSMHSEVKLVLTPRINLALPQTLEAGCESMSVLFTRLAVHFPFTLSRQTKVTTQAYAIPQVIQRCVKGTKRLMVAIEALPFGTFILQVDNFKLATVPFVP